jgi:hypothetical protein
MVHGKYRRFGRSFPGVTFVHYCPVIPSLNRDNTEPDYNSYTYTKESKSSLARSESAMFLENNRIC